ncbi:unnamed protein product, partial [Amoebophrya sp. A25]
LALFFQQCAGGATRPSSSFHPACPATGTPERPTPKTTCPIAAEIGISDFEPLEVGHIQR